MKSELFSLALGIVSGNRMQDKALPSSLSPSVKKAPNRILSYSERHRGQWFKPEYDLEEIQIAQDTDSYFFRSHTKKLNRFVTAGWEIVGKNPDTLTYIKTRLAEHEQATQRPFNLLVSNVVSDLLRFSNCMLVKVRNRKASSGKVRENINGRELEPVAGYFVLPFETLHFKTKANGEIKKIRQRTPAGQTKEFHPDDVVHFYINKKPGFAMGTPEAVPVLDDLALLRRIEENVEELIESNLFPLFHYSVGTDALPERYGPDGKKESDIVKETIEYMPAGGIYVSDHRHTIQAVGSEGRSLRVEGYLTYFKNRVFAGLGVSGVDMGEGDTANRATAQTLSKGAVMDIEALQATVKTFIEFYIFNELFKESSFNLKALSTEDKVEIKFGIVDKEQRTKLENQVIQLFTNHLIDEPEARKLLGYAPFEDEQRDLTYFKLYSEPLALIKTLGSPAADEALAEAPSSAITREGVERQRREGAEARRTGRPAAEANQGQQRASAATSRPSNQNGTRAGPKFDGNTTSYLDETKSNAVNLIRKSYFDSIGNAASDYDTQHHDNILQSLYDNYSKELERVHNVIKFRLDEYSCKDIYPETIITNIRWRIDELDRFYTDKAYNCGTELLAQPSSLGKNS